MIFDYEASEIILLTEISITMNYSELPISNLVDLLSQHTIKLSVLLKEDKLFSDEFESTKDEIHELTGEISRRKAGKSTIRSRFETKTERY
jgi:hypothetical protein